MGPAEHGVLLSSNVQPYPMIMISTKESIDFFGKIDFMALNGWLREERQDHSNPQVIAIRITYKPFNWIEIGVTRSTLYAGEGRPTYDPWEYFKFLAGTDENYDPSRGHYEDGNKFDNDAYAGVDFTVDIPGEWISDSITQLKVFYQQAGTDISAIWQKEDKLEFKPPFGAFNFLHKSHQFGLILALKKHLMRFEYTATPYVYYIHHYYPIEGYSYKGLSLGHPYGRNMAGFFFKHTYTATSDILLTYNLAYYTLNTRPHGSSKYMPWNFYEIFTADIGKVFLAKFDFRKRYGNTLLGFHIKVERKYNVNESRLATHWQLTNKDATFVTSGFSISQFF